MKAIWTLLFLFMFVSIQGCCIIGLFTKGNSKESKRDRQARELSEIAETIKTDNGILVRLEGDILFATGKTDLTPGSEKQIRAIANILKKYEGNKIGVTGHTDNVGKLHDNLLLSEGRAKAVKDELVTDGVENKAVTTDGMGERRPVVPNNTAANRTLNRRVELEIQTVD